MSSKREAIESPLEQGEDERIPYQITTTPWGSSPSSVTITLKRVDPDGTMSDVTSTNLTGSSSVAGDVITTPTVYGLTADTKYRLEYKFTTGTKVLVGYLTIFCKV